MSNNKRSELDKMRKNLIFQQAQLQRECVHYDEKEYWIERLSDKKNFRRDSQQYPKSALYCDECGKIFDGYKFSKDTTENAIWVIESMLEQIKLMGNLDNQQLDEVVDVIGTLSIVKDMAVYFHTLDNKEENDRNKKRNNNGGSRKSTIGPSQSMFSGAGGKR